MVFGNGVKNIQAAAYNGAHTVSNIPQKSIPSAVVYYYCPWYTFLRNRR